MKDGSHDSVISRIAVVSCTQTTFTRAGVW